MSCWECPDHLKTLMSSVKNEKQLCDVTIIAENEKIRVHRLILIAASKYFKAMFLHDTKESKTGIVRFPGTPKHIVKQCIEFIYTGEVEFSLKDIAVFIKTSDILGLDNLTELYVEFLSENVNQDNILDIISVALLHEREMLKESIEDFFLLNFKAFVESKHYLSMGCDSFTCMISLVDDFAGVNTKLKLITVMNWIKYDCDERKRHFVDLFQMIDVSFLSKEEIQNHIMNEGFVTGSEKCLVAVCRSMFGEKESPNLPTTSSDMSADSNSDSDSEQGTSSDRGIKPKRQKLHGPDDLKMSNIKKDGTMKMPSHIVTCNPTTSVVYIGDWKNDQWSRVTKAPVGNAEHLDILKYRRSIYIGCGSQLLCFDGTKWKVLWKHPQNTWPCYNRCVLARGCVYMVTRQFIVVHGLMNASTTRVSFASDIPKEGFFVANSAENLYIMGGSPQPGYPFYQDYNSKQAMIWKMETNRTQTLSPMIHGRNSGVGVFYQGTVYAIGGGPQSVEFLNPVTEQWQIVKGLDIACRRSKACLADKLYIFSRNNGKIDVITIELDQLQVSDENNRPTNAVVGSGAFFVVT